MLDASLLDLQTAYENLVKTDDQNGNDNNGNNNNGDNNNGNNNNGNNNNGNNNNGNNSGNNNANNNNNSSNKANTSAPSAKTGDITTFCSDSFAACRITFRYCIYYKKKEICLRSDRIK